MTQHFPHYVSQFLVLTLNYLLTNGINYDFAFVWMLHHVDSMLSLVVCFNDVEMAFKYNSQLICEYLVLSLLCCNVHH